MAEEVRIAFERRVVILPTVSILPQKKLSDAVAKTIKYHESICHQPLEAAAQLRRVFHTERLRIRTVF